MQTLYFCPEYDREYDSTKRNHFLFISKGLWFTERGFHDGLSIRYNKKLPHCFEFKTVLPLDGKVINTTSNWMNHTYTKKVH